MRSKGKGFTLSNSRAVFNALLTIGLFVLLFAGCGGGGGDDGDPTIEPDKNASVERSVRYTVSSLGDEAKRANGINKSQESLGYLNSSAPTRSAPLIEEGLLDGLPELVDGLIGLADGLTELGENLAQVATEFTCGNAGTVAGGNAVVFNFDGSCNGNSGSISVVAGDDGVSVDYDAFSTSDCEMTGAVSYRFVPDTEVDDAGTFFYAYENASICGQPFNATYNITDDGAGNVHLSLADALYAYDGNINLNLENLTSDKDQKTNGLVQVQVDGGSSTSVTVQEIQMDTSCGVPTSGALVVADADGEEVVVDFEGTTCDDPTVTYTVDGITQSMTLEGYIDAEVTHPTPDPDSGPGEEVDLRGTWEGEGESNFHFVIGAHGEDSFTCQVEIDTIDSVVDAYFTDEAQGTIEGDTVTIDAEFNTNLSDPLNPNIVTYVYTGTVEGNTYSGTYTVDGVDQGSFTAVRVDSGPGPGPGPGPGEEVDLRGTWEGEGKPNFHFVIGAHGEDSFTCQVEIDTIDSIVDAYFTDEAQGTIEGDTVTINAEFNTNVSDPLNPNIVTYVYTGTVEGNTYSGTYTVDGVDQGSFTAVRVDSGPGPGPVPGPGPGPGEEVDLSGTWEGEGGWDFHFVIGAHGEDSFTCQVEIDTIDSIVDAYFTDEAQGTIEGDTVTIDAEFTDVSDPLNPNIVNYVYTGTVEDGTYTGTYTVDGVDKGSFRAVRVD